MVSSENNDIADEQLVKAIRQNDHDAFKILYYRYYQKLIRFAYYRLHSAETARDLVQELFCRMWFNRERLDSGKSIKAYLYKALNNLIINHSKPRSSQTFSLSDFTNKKISVEDKQDTAIDIRTAIDGLPEKLKTVYLLSRVEGYKYVEIAEICSVSIKTVEKRMTKVFAVLRKTLK